MGVRRPAKKKTHPARPRAEPFMNFDFGGVGGAEQFSNHFKKIVFFFADTGSARARVSASVRAGTRARARARASARASGSARAGARARARASASASVSVSAGADASANPSVHFILFHSRVQNLRSRVQGPGSRV